MMMIQRCWVLHLLYALTLYWSQLCSRYLLRVLYSSPFWIFTDIAYMSGRKVTARCKYGYLQGFITDGDDIICPECAKDKLLANNWPITDQYCDLVTNHRPVLWSRDQSQIGIVILWPITDQYCDLVTNHRPVLCSCGHLVQVGGVITCWSPGVVLILILARVERERAVKHLTVILQFYLAHTFSPAVSLSKYFTSDSSNFSLLITSTFSYRYRS